MLFIDYIILGGYVGTVYPQSQTEVVYTVTVCLWTECIQFSTIYISYIKYDIGLLLRAKVCY